MTDQKIPYRTLPGGSIDYAHYARQAYTLRSRETFEAIQHVRSAPGKFTRMLKRLSGGLYIFRHGTERNFAVPAE